jgi:hypothetical protein
MRSVLRTLLVLAVPLAVLATSVGSARGQSPDNKVAAEALFEEGRRLAADGKYAEACPKFADSERLDPSSGTLLNLANCWEKIGRIATAWATYKEAESAANAAGRKDNEATAQRRADALAPKLSRVTLQVTQPIDGMDVKRDGVGVSRAEWGVAIPIDPGHHEIAATAPGFKTWSTGIDVGLDAAQFPVTVPALQPLPVEGPAAPASSAQGISSVPTSATSTARPIPPPPAADTGPPAPGGTQRMLGFVVGGLGVAGVGASAILALVAKAKYNDSLPNCEPNNPDLCGSTGLQQRSNARTLGDAATVSLGVGLAAIVAGGILWWTAPSGTAAPAGSAATRVRIEPTLGGVSLRGAW